MLGIKKGIVIHFMNTGSENRRNRMENNHLQKSADQVAGKLYKPAYYKSHSDVEQGLATTHEQVSDVYVEGTNEGKMDEEAGQENSFRL
jgi:hypothetical protein